MHLKLEDMDVESVVELLEKWQMEDFVEYVREKQVDGRKLLDVTEGIVKLWRPKVNAKKLISFVEDLKFNPGKYLGEITNKENELPVECQYQTVKKTKLVSTTTMSSVEELFKKLVPPKSFLYKNCTKQADKSVPSYVPMDGGTKKPKKFFRLSSYEYPYFDNILSRFSRHENLEDRGYYSIKTNSRFHIQTTCRRQDSRTKYKSLSTAEDMIEKYPEDHFYEDLCYNDVSKNDNDNTNDFRQVANVKPCMMKLQKLFQSLKVQFFKKAQVVVERDKEPETIVKENETNLYENGDVAGNMYDSVHVMKQPNSNERNETKLGNLPVEDYLEPVAISKDYSDVNIRQKEESLLEYIMSIFENRFGIRRETNDANQSEESDNDKGGDEKTRPNNNGFDDGGKPRLEADEKRCNMADRPLPVPVENEPYYMNVDRVEAENLLRGQPDGTFVLRPSSQSNHVYTLSVTCSGAVHNVGVRRRPDGRLALGFARRGESSFVSVPSLLRHHKRRRLLLVAAGGVLGATTLNETPHYYQTPSNIPIAIA